MYEFSKLSIIDRKVASWLSEKCPDRLFTFLEYLAEKDYPRNGIKLDAEKVFRELKEVHGALRLPVSFFH
ncbi:MAG TPA: hypothetical protein VIM65_19825 [Cyclobacteriaceae bacterium]